MGEQAFADGNLDEAEQQFIKAPHDTMKRTSNANYGLGGSLFWKKEFEKTEEDTQIPYWDWTRRSLTSIGKNSISLVFHFVKTPYDESIRYYEKSLEIVEVTRTSISTLLVSSWEGLNDRCITSLEQALAINPDFVEAQKFLNYCKKTEKKRNSLPHPLLYLKNKKPRTHVRAFLLQL